MGADPKRSALNGFNQMHEVKNLFVVDGSAFPNATEKNPTLTILALSWRATDYLARADQARRSLMDRHRTGTSRRCGSSRPGGFGAAASALWVDALGAFARAAGGPRARDDCRRRAVGRRMDAEGPQPASAATPSPC